MARVTGGTPISGTIAGATFYFMNGVNYVRAKSSLSRKRVLKDKRFAKTRECASKFGIAAQIGSVIYKALPGDLRVDKWLYRAIAGEAASLLYEGKEEEEVKEMLWKKYIKDTGAITGKEKEIEEGFPNIHPCTKEANVKLREVFRERWEKQGLGYYWFKRAWSKRNVFYPQSFRETWNLAYKDRKKWGAGY